MLGCNDKQTFDAMGIFENDEIIISSEINGKITNLASNEGDNVELNQVIASIDTTSLELKKEQILSQIEYQQKELNRIKNLLKANAETKSKFDNMDFNLTMSKKELAILEDQISKATIYAPIKGVILQKYANIGELTSPNKPLYKIANLDTLRLRVYITNADMTKIKLGDKVRVFSDFDNGSKEYEGIISYISSKAEFTPKTIMTKDERENLVYAIKIDVKNDGYLKLGQYGEIKFIRE